MILAWAIFTKVLFMCDIFEVRNKLKIENNIKIVDVLNSFVNNYYKAL